jgi:undecaprenyl-diphosphatase
LSTLENIDTGLFHLFNTTLTAPFLDLLVTVISKKGVFLGLAAIAAALFFFLGGRDVKWSVMLGLSVLFISDATSMVLKDFFARTRPCHALEGVRLFAECGASYSFPSSHASNVFAVMVLLTARYPAWAAAFLAAAFIVAWSRVYGGVHYPLDVLAGALLGSALAACVFVLDKRFRAQRLMECLERVKVFGSQKP